MLRIVGSGEVDGGGVGFLFILCEGLRWHDILAAFDCTLRVLSIQRGTAQHGTA